tara:strand:+ start:854 stop:1597 length:744 start_codon:yes stop_codon:yes gene_type:complete
MKLILLRHGESEWNLENRFTGWKDVVLTQQGILEAQLAAQQLIINKIPIETLYTSLLKRATETAKIVANKLNFVEENIIKDWRLNERHYGALQGLNKSETAVKYGEKQVHTWRRSFDISPPKLKRDDKRFIETYNKFKDFDISKVLEGESLKNVIDRLNPFWEEYFLHMSKIRGNHLIVAHSNSLRAIIKILDQLSSKEIMNVNIPTGVPLVYSFNLKNEIIDKKYLIDEKSLLEKQKKIKDQGKKK